MQRGGMISKEAQMTPFSLVVTFLARANEAHAKGSLFLDEDELREMKLGDGNSRYVQFYATVSSGKVKVWLEVQEGDFSVKKG
ncbi:hypothetical protein SAY87_015994 [Trapa incisa]|uniref:Uncharacterized protein n=1 Tax=Trapa incisa TaxID=236973 RepID=A0AAN7LBN4_9MYRT|nr:hypothetical protein SAY87_015994 [Trapa incisa]